MKWQTDKWQKNAFRNIRKTGIHPTLSKEKIRLLRETLERNEGSIHATRIETGIGWATIKKYGSDIVEKYKRKYSI